MLPVWFQVGILLNTFEDSYNLTPPKSYIDTKMDKMAIFKRSHIFQGPSCLVSMLDFGGVDLLKVIVCFVPW